MKEITNETASSLFDRQLREWNQLRKNYEAIDRVKQQSFSFGGFEVRVQFNAARAVSTLANVSRAQIEHRPCFLCAANRPQEQEGISLFDGKYTLLVNPFPIFKQHFTIASSTHIPQSMVGRVEDLLILSRMMSHYVVFYNGPGAGASAPDHLHFQAGNKGALPIENREWLKQVPHRSIPLTDKNFAELYEVNDGMRALTVYTSPVPEIKEEYLPEDSSNLIAWYEPETKRYILYMFRRSKPRPDCYYANGPEQLMISPGAVDMGGLLIVPREEDFRKLTVEKIRAIYREVSFPGFEK